MTADSGHVVTTNPSLLHQFFFSQALRTPDALAIDIPQSADGRRRRATYSELAGAARLVAHDLRQHVSGETLVALLFPRTSIEAYASQLGVLAAGAAYVSLDPALPDARLADMVADAEPAAVITDAAGAHRAAALGIDAARVLLAPGTPAAGHGTDAPPPSWLSPQTLAYVIYTSGTTGRPKGVMMAHRAITNLVASDVALFQLGPGDRVAQSSSHGYDSSVEEIWLALATGATLVVPDDQTVRAGPDVLDWLVGERITVWCPSPTLLRATGCRHAHEVPPALRLVYVGGEPMPPDVVAVWAPGRRLVNGYGPTECAVVATRAEMSPSRPVSIGWPIPGNEAWVLNQIGGDLVEAAPGEPGELCLGGVGLARGYWQAPDVTARKFVDHPDFGRLYRTGDLATRTDDGELYCHGRLDSQVKIRGHRVELEDIEAHLCRVPGVRAAACTVHGHSLVALVIPADRAAPPAARVVFAAAAAELPGHMVPARVVTVTELPMTAGGKLDRPRLPALTQDAVDQSHSMPEAPPSTPLEARIASAVSSVMGDGRPVPVDAHLFEALGADSLAAAEIVTALRMHEETAAVTVRDLYAEPTVRRLSERLAARTAAAGNGGVAGGPRNGAASSVNPARATVAQAAWLVATLLVGSATSAVVIVIALPWLLQAAGLVPFLLALPLVGAVGYGCYGALSIATALVTKRLLIGRYTPCREPVWGRFYVRNWIVQRAVGRMPWRLLEGTEFQVMLLRALGARIGRRVHLHRGVDLTTGGWDLLTIGDDVSLNQEAALRLIDVEAGSLVVGPITIENEATIEVRAGLGPRTLVERGATLTALSSLASGSRIPAGERWTGVPAEPDGQSAARPALTSQARTLSATTHGVLLMGVRLAVTGLAVAPWLGLALATVWMTGADAATVLAWLSAPTWSATSVGALAMLTIVPLPVTLALEAWVIRLLGPVRGGVIDRLTLDYARVWAKTLLVNDAGPWLSGSLAWRSWLRAAGMRLGPDAEVSTIIDVIPEQIDIGGGTFLTDGVYLGSPRVDRGRVTMAATRLGRRVFVGNHAVVPCGQAIPDGVLVGVCTVADAARLEPNSAWFGHPAFPLSRPPDQIDAEAFVPTRARYIARLFFETARFALPVLPVLAAILWFALLRNALATSTPAAFFALAAPAATVLAGALLCLMVLGLKWLLLGRVQPGHHDFWSCWCFRWDLVYVAWQQLARPVLSSLEGTLLLTWYLRAMGARIGRRVVLGRGFAQVVDPDMLRFDDDTTVRGLLQAHTFEGRVLKIDRVRVRRGASIGSNALLFCGADVGEATRVAAHSVVMKRERLPAGRVYEGCPTRLSTVDATAV